MHIGNDVWVGANCVILKGTTIGDHCVIAAGSVVSGEVPPGTVFLSETGKGSEMISIVVPVYKSERTLHRCVDSLLRQTYGDIEVLLVVDGSPDHSAEICEEYAAKGCPVRVLYRHNEGVSQARNRGVQAAGGEYICFVDSDDFIEANIPVPGCWRDHGCGNARIWSLPVFIIFTWAEM